MKVALVLSGLPRKVVEAYDMCWGHIIENYDTDVYLHFWKNEEYEKVLQVYTPKKYICEEPFSFEDFRKGVTKTGDNPFNLETPYEFNDNFGGFPMYHGWQQSVKLIEGEYDCVIRSRYDLGSERIFLEKLDLTKINISAHHWEGSVIPDDNLFITNQTLTTLLFSDIFDEFVSYVRKTGQVSTPERNLMEILNRKDLYKYINKTYDLNFKLLREK